MRDGNANVRQLNIVKQHEDFAEENKYFFCRIRPSFAKDSRTNERCSAVRGRTVDTVHVPRFVFSLWFKGERVYVHNTQVSFMSAVIQFNASNCGLAKILRCVLRFTRDWSFYGEISFFLLHINHFSSRDHNLPFIFTQISSRFYWGIVRLKDCEVFIATHRRL